jgi:hypothetical protein
MNRLKPRLNYANVVATLALFIAVGCGSAFAASQLGKKTVGTKQLKKNAVTPAKIRRNAVTTAKVKKQAITAAKVENGTLTGAQINASTLGTVPTAQQANTLAAPESWHEVGAPGEPSFQNGWENFNIKISTQPETVAFYKDHEGVVHLKGLAQSGSEEAIFQLPVGYRPADDKILDFVVACGGCFDQLGIAEVLGTQSVPSLSGAVYAPGGASYILFDGTTFRAES